MTARRPSARENMTTERDASHVVSVIAVLVSAWKAHSTRISSHSGFPVVLPIPHAVPLVPAGEE